MVNEILDKTLNYLNNLEQEIQKKTKTSKKSREGKKKQQRKRDGANNNHTRKIHGG